MKEKLLKAITFLLLTLLLPYTITTALTRKANEPYLPDVDEILIEYDNGTDSSVMDLSTYLVGVVCASIPSGYERETLKAQAVIARTYVLKNITVLNESKDSVISSKNTDTFTTSELGLDYMDTSTFLASFKQTSDGQTALNQIEAAVSQTQNEVITYKNHLITPLFCASTGGQTRDSSDVFQTSIPYLKSVDCEYDLQSTNYMTASITDAQTLLSILNDAYQAHLLDASDYDYQVYATLPVTEGSFFDTVQIMSRDSSGYVLSVSLGGVVVSGDSFASAVGLASTNFYLENYEESVRFICNGSGHGLGFSQYAANQMAKDGLGYTDLLTYFYTSVTIQSVYHLQ